MDMTVKNDTLPMDRLAKIYIKIRAAKQELTNKYEADLAVLETQLKTIAHEIKDQMQASGVKSMRTDYGTVVLSQKTRFWTQDWDAFKQFVVQHNAIDLLEKRVAQLNMARFLEDNPGVTPPGLNSKSEMVVSVRKTT